MWSSSSENVAHQQYIRGILLALAWGRYMYRIQVCLLHAVLYFLSKLVDYAQLKPCVLTCSPHACMRPMHAEHGDDEQLHPGQGLHPPDHHMGPPRHQGPEPPAHGGLIGGGDEHSTHALGVPCAGFNGKRSIRRMTTLDHPEISKKAQKPQAKLGCGKGEALALMRAGLALMQWHACMHAGPAVRRG